MPVTLEQVRAACVSAYRLRNEPTLLWGVRDWSKLRFEISEGRKTTVTIFGALERSGLGWYVWEQLGFDPKIEVVCVYAGN